jgi:hypothetical protein
MSTDAKFLTLRAKNRSPRKANKRLPLIQGAGQLEVLAAPPP